MKSTVYDFAVSADNETLIAITQDKKINSLSVNTGKVAKSFNLSNKSQDATVKSQPFLNTIIFDPSGSIMCAGSSDKSVHLIDPQTGLSLAEGFGHGDLITGLAFVNNSSRIVSSSANGSIFIWKVPENIHRRINGLRVKTTGNQALYRSNPSPIVFDFDDNNLPIWARPTNIDIQHPVEIPVVTGKWAQVQLINISELIMLEYSYFQKYQALSQ